MSQAQHHTRRPHPLHGAFTGRQPRRRPRVGRAQAAAEAIGPWPTGAVAVSRRRPNGSVPPAQSRRRDLGRDVRHVAADLERRVHQQGVPHRTRRRRCRTLRCGARRCLCDIRASVHLRQRPGRRHVTAESTSQRRAGQRHDRNATRRTATTNITVTFLSRVLFLAYIGS